MPRKNTFTKKSFIILSPQSDHDLITQISLNSKPVVNGGHKKLEESDKEKTSVDAHYQQLTLQMNVLIKMPEKLFV